jgi:hypothetical protein
MTNVAETPEAQALAKKGYLPALEVARRISKSKPVIYAWIKGGKVQGVRIGSHWYVLWSSVLDYYRDIEPEAVKLLGLK